MNTIVFWVAIYLALCCLISRLYLEHAITVFKPMGPIWCALGVLAAFLIGPLAVVYFIIQAIVDAVRKKPKNRTKKKTSRPQNKEELIWALVRERLELKEGEFFRFENQKHEDIYYFNKTALKKIECGRVRASSVSVNWILNKECKIVKLSAMDVHRYLAKYPDVLGGKRD